MSAHHLRGLLGSVLPSRTFGGPDTEFSLTVLFAEHYQFHYFPDLFDMISKICRRV